MELLPHQKRVIEKLSNGKILWGGVGSGKSLTVLGYYVKKQSPKDIFVITTAKKRDSLEWEGDAAKFGIGTSREATLHGVIVIDSWNNISKYTEIEDAFFVFDEQRVVGSGTWTKSFLKITKNNDWVMLTATPGDTWMDYIPVFIANNLYKNATQFKREHVVYSPFSKYPKVIGYFDVYTLERYRNMLLVEMPYLKHTERCIEEIPVCYDEQLFKEAYLKRWNVFENKAIEDASELFRVLRKIINSDISRLEAVEELIKKHKRLIIFYNFDYELEILRTLKNKYVVAEWNGHKKEQIPETESWVYLVQYVSGAEGWNCILTDTMIFYSLTYSWKNFEQAMGRIDRLNTPFTTLYYYILLSNSIVDSAVRKALSNKKLFNEKAFIKNHHIFDKNQSVYTNAQRI